MSKKWTCIQAIKEGCNHPDDEIINITGEMFGKVLDLLGIKTRKALANSLLSEFDSGPWEPYVENWIMTARTLELGDAMKEIFETEDPEFVEDFLHVTEIVTPSDLLKFEVEALKIFVNEILQESCSDIEERILVWQEKASNYTAQMPWL